jgi:ribulose-phosphate 3-epimerase
MSLVVPAVLPTSREDLEEKLKLFARIPSVSRVQIDVVDGKFATPASWPYTDSTGSPQAAQEELQDMVAHGEMLPHLDRFEYEIDLMCLDVEQAAKAWLALGASRLTFHIESFIDPHWSLASIHKRYGSDIVSFGIALNIATDLASLKPCLADIAYVQCMGITTIGRQGQIFDKNVLDKVKRFREWHPLIPVQVDGGVSIETARELVALGVTNLVVGSALLRAPDMGAEIAKFDALQTPFGV